MSIFLGLLHYPVLNRLGEVGSTAVTNVDIHDLARAARTYGVQTFFIVTPIDLQQMLVGRVLKHWTEGPGAERLPTRSEALKRADVVDSLDTAIANIQRDTGQTPEIIVTGANLREGVQTFASVREHLQDSDRPALLLFGTGHGLAPGVIERADIRLPAIESPQEVQGYNHLSVRAAVVIILDRLFGVYE